MAGVRDDLRTGLGVRDVTDEEVATLERNGWVKLDGLISPEFAAELLRVASDEVRNRFGGEGWWTSVAHIARDHGIEPFRSLALGPQLGRNAQRLINRKRLTYAEIPIRYHGDRLARKEPSSETSHGAEATPSHQDLSAHTWQDRVGSVMFWIALAEVTPEHGAMRFVTGSHREGPLGMLHEEQDVLQRYPKLRDIYEISPPLHYRPGDATVHHCGTIHGAPENTTNEPRWSYVIGYLSGDIRYTGAPFNEAASMSLQPGDLFTDQQFPIVF